MALTWKKLAYEEDVVTKALFDANTILAATGDDTPAAITIAEEQIVGRITAGDIKGMTATEVRTMISVADGANVTGDNAPKAHAASHKDGAADEILLHELGEPTSAVDMNEQQLEDVIIHTVADAAALAALTNPTIGKFAFQTDTLAAYICTAAS